MYFLTRLLYTRIWVLITIALFGLGSPEVLLYQLRATGGYPEIVLLGALIFLLVLHLTLTTSQADRGQKWGLLYGLLGFLIGFALWTDQLILPCIAATALLLFCRQELRRRRWIFLLIGQLIGASPLIAYNLTASFGRTSVNILLDL